MFDNFNCIGFRSDLPEMPAVYVLIHRTTGYFYIGSTNSLGRRMRRHTESFTHGHYNRKLHNVVENHRDELDLKYMFVETEEEARALEQRYLDQHIHDPHCCNEATGATSTWGGGVPAHQRAKMVAGATEYAQSERGREAARKRMLGIPRTEEHKRRVAEKLTGLKRSPETIEKLRIAKALDASKHRAQYDGWGMSPENRAKVSARRSTRVEIDGVRYASVGAAAKAHDIVSTSVTNRIRSTDPRFSGWKYVEE